MLKEADTFNHTIHLNGKRYHYFAQNSPEWEKMVSTEIKDDRHTFGESGCACAALANAIVNCVEPDTLYRIQDIFVTPIRIDTTSLVRNRGVPYRNRFIISSAEDYFRYFPLCIANYAAGNNRIGSRSTRSTAYYSKLFNFYSIPFRKTSSNSECLSALRSGDYVIMCSAGKHSPFSNVGHFILCIDIDDEYVYILDSYIRDHYPLDRQSLIEIIEPGLIRIAIEDFDLLSISGTRFIVTPVEHSVF